MKAIRKLMAADAPISDAIVIALKNAGFETITAFAAKHGRDPSNMANIINGRRAPAEADIIALVRVLGGKAEEWRELLHEAGRPAVGA